MEGEGSVEGGGAEGEEVLGRGGGGVSMCGDCWWRGEGRGREDREG